MGGNNIFCVEDYRGIKVIFTKKNKRCYYKKYSSCSYAKAVVWIKTNPYNVVSAYEISDIKESKYPNLRKLV